MDFLKSQRTDKLLEKLLLGVFACAVIADTAGAEGAVWNEILPVAGWLAVSTASVAHWGILLRLFAATLVNDIIFLATWTDRGAVVQTFISLALIIKVGVVFFGRRFEAELAAAAGGGGGGDLGAKLAAEGGAGGDARGAGGEEGARGTPAGAPTASSAYSAGGAETSSYYAGSYQQA